jgi:hypothetical protein
MASRIYPNLNYTIVLHTNMTQGKFEQVDSLLYTGLRGFNLASNTANCTWEKQFRGTTCRDSLMNAVYRDIERFPFPFLYETFGVKGELRINIGVSCKSWFPWVAQNMANATCKHISYECSQITIPIPPVAPGGSNFPFSNLHYMLLYMTLTRDAFTKTEEPIMNKLYRRFNEFILANPAIFDRESNCGTVALFTAFKGYLMSNGMSTQHTVQYVGSALAAEFYAMQSPLVFIQFVKEYGIDLRKYQFYGLMYNRSHDADNVSLLSDDISVYDVFGKLMEKERKGSW